MPTLSIGLPVYNGQNFLQQAIDSLLSQTFDDFELFICDNASTDATLEIAQAARRRDRRVHIHRNERNLGAAPNFNLAFRLASGAPYFKWAAHDDVCQPTYLERCVMGLEAHPECVLAHTDVALIDAAGQGRPHDEELPLVGSPRASVRFEDLISSDHWCTPVFGVMRREVLAQTTLLGSYAGSDRVLLAELGLRGPFHWTHEALFQNRDHAHRSVHATALRSRERVVWFDTSVSVRGEQTPFFQAWVQYLELVLRLPLPAAERSRAMVALLRWIPANRWGLRSDAAVLARQVLGWFPVRSEPAARPG